MTPPLPPRESFGPGLILGLTGSLGSGKSFVASLLEQCQATVISADRLAREATAPGSDALAEIQHVFGPEIVTADGQLDRPELARKVFRDPEARARLESILHPRVRSREYELLKAHASSPLRVLDVPLLFESGLDCLCDRTVTVTIDEDTRLARLLRDRSMTPSQVRDRLAAQMPQAEKARRSDFLIENSGSRAKTASQVQNLLQNLFPKGLPQPLADLPLQDFPS